MKTIYGITAPVSEYMSALGNEFFTTEELAGTFTKGAGWYGSDGRVTPVQVFDSLEDYQEWRANETKRKAIQKAYDHLSPSERAALGIKF